MSRSKRCARLMLSLPLALTLSGCSANSTSEQPKTITYAEAPKASDDTAQAKAIAEIKKFGGEIGVDEQSAGKPVFIVSFTNTMVTDAALVDLKSFPQQRLLTLGNTKVTDDGLAHLEGLTKLTDLSLWGTNLTDDGLAHLEGLSQLQSLHLGATQISDAGLEHIKGLKQLLKLNLQRTIVTDEGVAKLHRALPNCKIIR